MNRLLAGLPGSGKSHHAVVLIREALKDARVVVTNVAVIADAIERLRLPGLLVVLSEAEMDTCDFLQEYPGGFFVFDEVRRWIPSGLQQKQLPAAWDRLLSEHRHAEDWRGRSSEVVLISQCASQLPRCVRTLIDNTLIFTKLNKLGMKSAYVGRIYTGPQTIMEPRRADSVSSFRAKYRRDIFALYRSHSKARGSGRFAEDGDKGQSNLLHGFQFKSVGVALVLGLGAVIYFLTSGWGGIASEPQPDPEPHLPAPQPQREADSANAEPSGAVARVTSEVRAKGEGVLAPVMQARVMTVEEAALKPRIAARPETAPLYDEIREPQSLPTIRGCLASVDRCHCYTWQGTDAGLSVAECRAWLASPPFNPWKVEPDPIPPETLEERLARMEALGETLQQIAERQRQRRLEAVDRAP